MKLHEKIILYRKKNGLSQEALAEKIGVSRQAVSKWEVGEALPEVTKLKAIADTFGVTVDFLLDEEKSEQISNETEQTSKQADIEETALDRFLAGINTFSEKLFQKMVKGIKKNGWIFGIVLIVYSVYQLVASVIGIGQFYQIGIDLGGFYAISILNILKYVGIVIGGIFIIVKFGPKKKEK